VIGNATVTVVSVTTTVDADGNSTTTQTESTLEWAAVAPRASTERPHPRAPAVITAASLYAPYATVIDPDDTVRIADHSPAVDGDWQVEGKPGPWASPFSDWRPGIEVALKRAS
jgi:hypothetical protein